MEPKGWVGFLLFPLVELFLMSLREKPHICRAVATGGEAFRALYLSHADLKLNCNECEFLQ